MKIAQALSEFATIQARMMKIIERLPQEATFEVSELCSCLSRMGQMLTELNVRLPITPALFLSEGMLEDKHGSGFFRIYSVTRSEAILPDVEIAVAPMKLLEVRKVELIKTLEPSYRIPRLHLDTNRSMLLFDELKEHKYEWKEGKWERFTVRG